MYTSPGYYQTSIIIYSRRSYIEYKGENRKEAPPF